MSKVLFVGWDAADRKAIGPLMDAGKMPNLQRLVQGGAMPARAPLPPSPPPCSYWRWAARACWPGGGDEPNSLLRNIVQVMLFGSRG